MKWDEPLYTNEWDEPLHAICKKCRLVPTATRVHPIWWPRTYAAQELLCKKEVGNICQWSLRGFGILPHMPQINEH